MYGHAVVCGLARNVITVRVWDERLAGLPGEYWAMADSVGPACTSKGGPIPTMTYYARRT